MIRKDDGVVLKTARSGETSKLVTFIGRESGKVRLLAKGALKENSPLRGAVEPGNHLEVLYYFRENRTLYYVKEAHVHSSLDTRRDSLARLSLALAVLELVDDVCYWESPEERIVDLVLEYLRHAEAEDPVLFFLAFEFKLLAVLGALPDFPVCSVCGESPADGFFHPEAGVSACPRHSESSSRRIELDRDSVAVLAALAVQPLAAAARQTVSSDLRKRLGSIFHWTYTYHVENYRLPESLNLLPKE